MKRKTYYYILAIGLSIIFLVKVFGILFLNLLIPVPYSTLSYKDLFVMMIVIVETQHAETRIRRINSYLYPVAFIGYLFRIQHWPLNALLFQGSLSVILLLLFINAYKHPDRFEKTVLLVFPLFYLIDLFRPWHFTQLWWTIDLLIIVLTAGFLWTRIFKRKIEI